MSNTNSVFKKVPSKVQRLNGFDQSHLVGTSSNIGTLTPVLVKRLMPGDIVSLGSTFRVNFPPFATSPIGKITAHMRAFFCPERILYGNFKSFLMYSGGLADQFTPAGLTRTYLPTLTASPSAPIGPGSLMDHLGYKTLSATGFNGLRSDFAGAYHKIWADWYRDPRLQVDPFYEGQSGTGAAYMRGTTYSTATTFTYGTDDTLADGYSIFDLRQVNYEKDYFTTAFTDQYGGANPMSVAVAPFVLPGNPDNTGHNLSVRTASGDPNGIVYADSSTQTHILTQIGTFSIPQVRAANLLEKFAEKLCLCGGVYQDAILAEYGVRPSDGLVDRSIYLGSLTASVYNNTVYASATDTVNAAVNPRSNPFAGQQGASSSDGKAIGSGSYVDKFQAKEHGVFMVLLDVVPHATYGTGTNRELFSIGDGFVDLFTVPSLAGIGHQPIYQAELVGGDPTTYGSVFGYTDRYADQKWTNDSIHGKLITGQSLDSFAIQRVFDPANPPTINSAFVQVSVSDLDNVTAVVNSLSTYGYWCDIFHSFKIVRPLPGYSIPSLEGLENTETVMVDRNGRRF